MSNGAEIKKGIVEFFMKKGILISSDLLMKIEENPNPENLKEIINRINSEDMLILSEDIAKLLEEVYAPKDINWKELEQSKAFSEKGKENTYDRFIEFISSKQAHAQEEDVFPVKIVSQYNEEIKKWAPDDFVEHFNIRLRSIEKLLRKRTDVTGVVSINRLGNKKDKESVTIIGMVLSKDFTKNNNLILAIEDSTGLIKVVVNKNKPQLFDEAMKIALDEVIAIQGVSSNGVVFVNNIVWPDVPVTKELKKCNEEVYAIFLSDLHIGSKYFLAEDFMKFIKWLNLEIGDETQQRIAKKIGYIFLVGDIVDGCGVYPGQEDDLLIKDIKLQYAESARLLSMIPKHIKMVMCAGNHDAMRLTEPQLPIYRDFAEELYDLPNLIHVHNPALINIHAKGSFSGFDVLLYHGYSFDYFVANVDYIRNSGGYERVDIIMKYLLQRRHLAPTHSSNSYIPDTKLDPLVIETVPDIFVTGHIHKAMLANYRGITLINASCWQSITDYQKRHGHKPDPGRVPVVNLQTREARLIRFTK